MPVVVTGETGAPRYYCPWSSLADAEARAVDPHASDDDRAGALVDLNAALIKEVDLRFQGMHWNDQCRAKADIPAAPPTPPPPAAKAWWHVW